jgi:23S rRNA U2552 (ribose-2'-O)-methylase RlmE/FtsJ
VIGKLKKTIKSILARLGIRIIRTPFRIERCPRRRTIADYKAAQRLLSAELLEPVTLGRSEPDNELFSLFRDITGVHKWHHYFDIYSKEFGQFRDRPIRILEIGVSCGGSLQVWKRWFHEGSLIVGIDIQPSCQQYQNSDQNIFVRVGDQSDHTFLKAVADEFGPFDLIIDDGGHLTSQMIASFNCLFGAALVPGGIYLVEDTHTNYWQRYTDSKLTFIDFCKQLVDFMHSHYLSNDAIGPFSLFGTDVVHELEVPYIQAWLQRISFYDSIVALEKNARAVPVHEMR